MKLLPIDHLSAHEIDSILDAHNFETLSDYNRAMYKQESTPKVTDSKPRRRGPVPKAPAPYSIIHPDDIRDAHKFDPSTGEFFKLVIYRYSDGRPDQLIPDLRFAGRITNSGGVVISHKGIAYYAHRLAWLHTYGEWPPRHVIHVNGNLLDNRPENLALSGAPVGGKHRARVMSKGLRWNLGYFATKDEAEAAEEKARFKLSIGLNPLD